MDYKNGKIYRIVCNETGLCYIGSTTSTLVKRLSQHKCKFKQYLEGKYPYTTSYKILENNNYDIVLIEEVLCENKDQLHKRERFYIESMECVNKNIPTRNLKEYREDNKEYLKEYSKKWRKDHLKEYNEINKEKIKEKDKKYREKNKEEINRKKREKRMN